MSYTANQYNYATPLSSAGGLVSENSGVADIQYFTLHDNKLDGTCVPISGDVGLWSSAVSDGNGVLSTPFIIDVELNAAIHAVRVVGSEDSYPVNFTIELYNGDSVVQTIAEAGNSGHEYVCHLSAPVAITKYVITITKISAANSVARVYNTYTPNEAKRVDNNTLYLIEASSTYQLFEVQRSDTLSIRTIHPGSTIDKDIFVDDVVGTRLVSTHAEVGDTFIDSQSCARIFLIEQSTVHCTIDVTHDTLSVLSNESTAICNTIVPRLDAMRVKLLRDTSNVLSTIDIAHDELVIDAQDEALLHNVHTIMKAPSRRIYGKVYITYTDPMYDGVIAVSGGAAYNSQPDQMFDGAYVRDQNLFNLYENDLTGRYTVSNDTSQVGWVSDALSGPGGYFDESQRVEILFASRPVFGLTVHFDNDVLVKDFSVSFVREGLEPAIFYFVDNNEVEVRITDDTISDVVAFIIEVSRVSKSGYPAVIVDVQMQSTVLYVGYQDRSDLISIDLLEELTYQDEVEALGGVSANEATIVLDNSNKDFYYNNDTSIVARQLKPNRKIVPWLGVEITPDIIEWYEMGTFWSYNWKVPVGGLTATVVGFDTIGLLDKTSFTNHTVQTGKSIGALIEYVLLDAKKQLRFIDYVIDPALYDIIIPYAWFEPKSHAAALRRISLCYPMHIYCDRQGRICAAPQKLRLDYYYDVWADDTNVIDKNYDSLYTSVPNIVNVTVVDVLLAENISLVKDEATAVVSGTLTKTLMFNKPYVSDISVVVDKVTGVDFTYEVYSWGIAITFTGSGLVSSVECFGTAVDTSNSFLVSRRDDISIMSNGAITRDVSSDFIQTDGHANAIIERIFNLSEYDKYDVSVSYRGDISLTINDPILLSGGVAPDNRYNIKRHQLFWNGALTGSADLNT